VRLGDFVTEVAGEPVGNLAELFRRVWSIGPAGSDIPLTLSRGEAPRRVRVHSANRNDFLMKPLRH
jgi:S1-C subfamily serine protease